MKLYTNERVVGFSELRDETKDKDALVLLVLESWEVAVLFQVLFPIIQHLDYVLSDVRQSLLDMIHETQVQQFD